MVILIMVGYYRLSGVLAVLALALYILFTLGGLAVLDATLTLPGPRGPGALDRHRGRRERADLRADSRGAPAGQDDPAER